MKLNETNLVVGNRCCSNHFVEHFFPLSGVEDDETIANDIEVPENNPEVEVGENFTCPVCGNIILLNSDKEWQSLPPNEVVDLEPMVVEEELTTPEIVV